MMETISTYLLDFLVALALGLFLKYLVPYVKSKITSENLSFVKTWVDKLVAAAEQTITGSKMGTAKKAWVLKMLDELEITVDDGVDALIEAAVKELKTATDAAAKAVSVTVEAKTGVSAAEATAAVEGVESAVK
jgi:hypothetical protein